MNAKASELSALFDGELEEHEVRAAVTAALDEDDLRDSWQLYALIGDGLRGDCPDAPDLAASVMAHVREEPVVLAPRNLRTQRRTHPMYALAASLAGVAVVGWLALAGNPRAPAADGAGSTLAAASPAPSIAKVEPVAVGKPADSQPLRGDMSEYLLAHQLQAGTPHPAASTRQIRTVAMSGGGERP